MRILGIETSCDETAVSIIDAQGSFGPDFAFSILGNALISQVKEHARYGGVFPNIAKREHQRALVPVMSEALRQADMLLFGTSASEGDIALLEHALEREPDLFIQMSQFFREYAKPPIDAIAVTVGPGLEPALWVGINFAKALSRAWSVPLVPVNHMEGHIMLAATDGGRLAKFSPPLLSLLISGGHTELVLSRQWLSYERIGATRDDAVGEAFDKVARLLGLPYPGGPEISRLADAARGRAPGTLHTVTFPRPMIDSPDYDFSFSGLKTAVRRLVEDKKMLSEDDRSAIALEFENAASDVLVAKTMHAIEEFGARAVLVGGGVSANSHIRSQLSAALNDYGLSTSLLIPPPELATDNALMIALAGYFRALNKEFAEPSTIQANGNLKLV